MSGAVGDIGVFIGTDQKRLDGYRLAAHEIFIGRKTGQRIEACTPPIPLVQQAEVW
jgi:hypothetical protein